MATWPGAVISSDVADWQFLRARLASNAIEIRRNSPPREEGDRSPQRRNSMTDKQISVMKVEVHQWLVKSTLPRDRPRKHPEGMGRWQLEQTPSARQLEPGRAVHT
jgi:hypothetical protein